MRCHFTPTKMLIIKKPTAISVNKNIKRVRVAQNEWNKVLWSKEP